MITSNASGQPAAAPRSLPQLMRQHPLFSFFFLAYAGSWIISIPIVLAEWGFLSEALFLPLFAIKPFVGPFLAAYVMTRLLDGREGVLRMRRSMLQARAGWQWYLGILLGIPALFVLGIIIQPGALASWQGFPRGSVVYYAIYYLINFVLIFLFGGPLGEEPGWRGFALPRIQAQFAEMRLGPLWATLILGVVWSFWHLPDFLTSAQGGGPGTGWGEFFLNLPIFTVMVVAIAVVMTWVYNRTRSSLFIAILLHASINTSGILPELFPAPNIPIMTMSNVAMLIAMVVPALLIALLTRGQLGYEPNKEQA